MPLRATKIVATLGPASSDPALLEAMIRAGVNVVRLNFSHGKAEDHIERARLVREAAQRAGREVGIMADLQGPKIRVGKFAQGKVMLQAGQPFVLDASRTEPGDDNGVGLDYKELPRDVRPGDTLLLNDGLIVMKVEKVVGPAVHTTVTMGGELSNNKGINKQGGGLTAPALTAKDMDDIKTAMGLQADYVAVSFPKSATDMELARQLCNVAAASTGHKPGLIAKIERAEAIPELASILKVSDGIMVARGDLAVEVGNAAVPALQKHMIKLAREMCWTRWRSSGLIGKIEQKGYTLVPINLHWKSGKVKCDIALAKGKAEHDKRDTIKDREGKREVERAMKSRHRDR